MRVDQFAYDLPADLIAQEPAKERDQARLMVVEDERLRHSSISGLPQEIDPGSLIVVNDTKVIRARILGLKEGSGGKAEVFLIKRDVDPTADGLPEHTQRWRAMARASKPMKPGAIVKAGPLIVEIEGRAPDDGLFRVTLRTEDPHTMSVDEALKIAAHVPLPPYIKRPDRPEDEERYQTVFARAPGAVAAPTAGLHLTRDLLDRLEGKGCEIASCTLHVGLGTFEPVKTDDLDDHPMHAEYFEVSPTLASAIARARERRGPVVAIGTTVVRALESAAETDAGDRGLVRPSAAETRILIQPGYRFRVVDRLLTNFHLPKSTLLALVCAFAGMNRVMRAYGVAVHERYRFFSYGDAMLLSRSS